MIVRVIEEKEEVENEDAGQVYICLSTPWWGAQHAL